MSMFAHTHKDSQTSLKHNYTRNFAQARPRRWLSQDYDRAVNFLSRHVIGFRLPSAHAQLVDNFAKLNNEGLLHVS